MSNRAVPKQHPQAAKSGAATAGGGATPVRRAKRMSGRERRRLILESAREVFKTSGFDGARIKEIARRADTAEAMLYRHFSSKEELFNEAIIGPLEDWMQLLPESADRVRRAKTDAERRAVSRQNSAELIRATSEIIPLLGVVLFSNPERGAEFYRMKLQPVLMELTKASAKGFVGWEHRKVDPHVWAMITWGFALANAVDSYFCGKKADPDVLASELVEVMAKGVGSANRSSAVKAKSA